MMPVRDDPSLTTELRIAVNRLHRCLRLQRGSAELPEAQFAVLAIISKHGPMTPGALAEHERMRPPAMTRAINCLAELGLVDKAESQQDARQVIVSLTAAGEGELAETRRRREAWLDQRLAALTDAERDVLLHASHILNEVTAK